MIAVACVCLCIRRYFLAFVRLCGVLCVGRNVDSLNIVNKIIPLDAAIALFNSFRELEVSSTRGHRRACFTCV